MVLACQTRNIAFNMAIKMAFTAIPSIITINKKQSLFIIIVRFYVVIIIIITTIIGNHVRGIGMLDKDNSYDECECCFTASAMS